MTSNPTNHIIVTIHKDDGHKVNGIFSTTDQAVVSRFCDLVKPLKVTMSRGYAEHEISKFKKQIDPSFIDIDPNTYQP